jgi:hypothetical protein
MYAVMLTMEATAPRAKNGYLSMFAQAEDEFQTKFLPNGPDYYR